MSPDIMITIDKCKKKVSRVHVGKTEDDFICENQLGLYRQSYAYHVRDDA